MTGYEICEYEVLAVGDERADEAEDLADASGLGPIWIGVVGFDLATAGPDMNTIRTQMPGTWQELFLGSREFSGDAGAGWLPVPEAGGGGVF